MVTIPPHIRDDINAHLHQFVTKSDELCCSLPFAAAVFNDTFKRAAKSVDRDDLSAHDLRRFAGSKNAQVATLTENMAGWAQDG